MLCYNVGVSPVLKLVHQANINNLDIILNIVIKNNVVGNFNLKRTFNILMLHLLLLAIFHEPLTF